MLPEVLFPESLLMMVMVMEMDGFYQKERFIKMIYYVDAVCGATSRTPQNKRSQVKIHALIAYLRRNMSSTLSR